MTQRERFEAWVKKGGVKFISNTDRRSSGEYCFNDVETAWRAWQAACPEGWQVVPELITSDMIEQGFIDSGYSEGKSTEEHAWDMMLSAAPMPGDV